MFETELSEKLKTIFDFDKVKFETPSDMREQEVLFVEIEQAKNTIKDKQQLSLVTGTITVLANQDKLPYGYFSKKIHEASHDLTKDFFFYDFENNSSVYRNIVSRSLSFNYIYKGQYNTNDYKIEEIELTIN
jgi:hypothetical protein